MGIISDIFGGGSQTVVQQPVLTSEQRELIQRQVELADIQIAEIGRQREAQAREFGAAEAEAGALRTSIAGEEERAAEAAEAEQELLQLQLENVRAGGEATPQEVNLINQAIERALASGETDIRRFQTQATEQLREELAPQLGLRPGDTPILDRGGRIVAEAGRQQGQLVNQLRGQQAQSLLDFPLRRASVFGGLNLAQQDLTQRIQQFQSQLRQSAFANRLQLAGARSTAGLGLAGVSAPNISAALAGQGTTQTTSGTASFGDIAGGIGSVLLGLGAVGLSSREFKDIDGEIDEEAALEAVKKMPVGLWNYKGEYRKHIGTYAEDFRKATGVGDGKTISYIDNLGVLTAAVKALAKRDGAHGTA